jgi:hypothetical protein
MTETAVQRPALTESYGNFGLIDEAAGSGERARTEWADELTDWFYGLAGRSATMLRVSRRCSSVGRAAVL